MQFQDIVNKLIVELRSYKSALEMTYNTHQHRIVVKGFNRSTKRWEEIVNLQMPDKLHIHQYQEYFNEIKFWDQDNMQD